MRFQDLSDVQRLIDQGVREVPALEFKSDVSLDGEAAKKKFLRDVTSMGNGGGGTIIFGLTADDSSGVGVATELSPVTSPAILSIMENIVRDVVRPPLLWTLADFQVGDGRVVVAEVQPSALGPYMLQGYDDNRYYRRGETGVVKMTEFEVSSAYALAHRTAEQRDDEWRKHFLPMKTPTDQTWLSIAALPFEPFLPIFEGREVNSFQVVHPPAIGKCLFGLPIHQATVRHWADGITADDGLIGKPLTFKLRLHRDGAAGIAQKLENFIDLPATARAVNAYLAYLADFWATYSLRSPIELDIGISDISRAVRATVLMGGSAGGIVHPPDVTVTKVGVSEEVLPWELTRAHVRHGVVRRFIERLSYAFDLQYTGEYFSVGPLFLKGGAPSGLLLGPGVIVRRRSGGSNAIALIDEAGRIHGGAGGIKSFVVDGVVIDEAGDTLALVEMTDGIACPPDFLSDYSIQESGAVLAPWSPPTADQGGPEVPAPTGKWSSGTLEAALS
jgi:hypothetical protein